VNLDIINPKKTEKEPEDTPNLDIQKIKYILHLVKEKGYTFSASSVIKSGKRSWNDKVEAVQKYTEIRPFF